MIRVLTTRQSARALLAIHDYFSRLRALSSLWLARPREWNCILVTCQLYKIHMDTKPGETINQHLSDSSYQIHQQISKFLGNKRLFVCRFLLHGCGNSCCFSCSHQFL